MVLVKGWVIHFLLFGGKDMNKNEKKKMFYLFS